MKKFIKKIITGNSFPNEYLCIDKTNFDKAFTVYLFCPSTNEKSNISTTHFLLGYKPLLIGINKTGLQNFYQARNETKFIIQFYFASKLKAEIKVVKINPVTGFENEILLFKGVSASHQLQSFVQKKINRIIELLKKKAPGNIYLNNNLYDQVRIAYCVPRIIALAIVKYENKYNVFPTDLHGKISENFYIDSLRSDNKANEQVVSARQFVIAFIKPEMFRTVYSLGPRHTKGFCDANEFNFLIEEESKVLGIRLPSGYVGYVELELIHSQMEGIHNLHYFKILYEQPVKGNSQLAHVHALITNWRKRKNILTEYFIR